MPNANLPSQSSPSSPLIGLAVGEGTGPELAAVFEEAVAAFTAAAGTTVRLHKSNVLYRTFGGVMRHGLTAADVARSSVEDAAAYEDFVRELVAAGGRAIFRTAFNAQPLYVVRERLTCVKVESLPNAGGECLLIRDQAQGFYAGDNDTEGRDDRVVRTCVFSKDKTHRVLDFAVAEARRRFGDDFGPIVMAYKFHLLDLRFAHWVEDYAKRSGLDVRVFQPDTMNRHLLKGTFRGNFVVVGGNEWGDIMHADILARAGLGNQDERCSHNVYLDPTLQVDGHGLVELQTVHGSADDIAEQDRVNPTATLRAAARILEDFAGIGGLAARLEQALAAAAADGFLTPDVGGKAGSRAVAEAVIARTVELVHAPDRRRATADTALVVVDMQRDFCAADGRFAELGLIDPVRIAALEAPLAGAIAHARGAGWPVIFVRTHADAERLPPRVAARHARSGRDGYLRAGTPGAEPFAVRPAPGDALITKTGYDAFHGTELESLLARRGVERLVVAGVFAELCVDAVARGAFQRGLGVTVLADATLGLERDAAEVLGFMRRFYDADIVTSVELAASDPTGA